MCAKIYPNKVHFKRIEIYIIMKSFFYSQIRQAGTELACSSLEKHLKSLDSLEVDRTKEEELVVNFVAANSFTCGRDDR